MAKGATFLGGAKSRLLPASVPFRFFGAAMVFLGMAWIFVIVGAEELPSFVGGLGWPLAALHAVTLGVLVMTAIGASLQLLPVATRTPVASGLAPALLWWLIAPGVALLVVAMGLARPDWLAVAAAVVVSALAAYGALLALNLHRARGMPVVVAHGWVALASLALLLASAGALVLMYLGLPSLPRDIALGLHVAFGAYGFMGMLALGFAYILVPMFALGDTPLQTPSLASLALAVVALALAALGASGVAAGVTRPAALGCGAAALALHLLLMRRVLRGGMRRDLGRPFVLVRLGWTGLGASLAAAAAVWLDLPGAGFAHATALFGALLVGSLLSFLLGMLARIVPFLAAMHAAPGRRGPPLPSALSAERPLALGVGCHLAALAALLVAVLAGNAMLVRIAGTLGVAAAAGWAGFVGFAWWRTRVRAPDLR
jgi:hypothetical protein